MNKILFAFRVSLYILLFISPKVYSFDDYNLKTYSPLGGLSYRPIVDICQDNTGFIWILLNNNIFRYDGYEYKSYYINMYHQNSSIRYLSNFAVDTFGNLHLSTNNGLYRYDNVADSFNKLVDGNITTVFIDKKNNFWIIKNSTLLRSDQGEYKDVYYKNLKVSNVLSFTCNEEEVFVAVGHNYEIYRSGLNNQFHLEKLNFFPSSYKVIDIKANNHFLWVLTRNNGIVKLNTQTNEIEWEFDSFVKDSDKEVMVRKLHIDKDENIWVGCIDGAFIIDPQTSKYKHIKYSPFNRNMLPNKSIWTIGEDSQKNLWLGTYSGGISYVNLSKKNNLRTFSQSNTKLGTGIVSSFTEDKKNLWIGTEGGGLVRMEKNKKNFTYYEHGVTNYSPTHKDIKSLVIDSAKNLWIGTFNEGLSSYNIETKRFQNYNTKTSKLFSNNVRKILLEGNLGLWITYVLNRDVVTFFSFKDQSFKHYYYGTNGWLYDITRGKGNDLWLASSKTLYLMDISNFEIKDISSKEIDFLNAQSLYANKNGNVWIGTNGKGLIYYNKSNSSFTYFKEILAYNVLSISSICEDEEENLWLGTDNGLFRYTPSNNSYIKMDEHDGLQGSVFYPLASYRGDSEFLYFGGTNGFTMLDIKQIKFDHHKPKAIISDVIVNNAPIKFNVPIGSTEEREISLDYQQADFIIKFTSDNYQNPAKTLFKYRLKGHDKDWITTDATFRTAIYSKIAAGKYKFELLASNGEGLWSDIPATIIINRRVAPWLSWQAFIIYTVIVLAGLFFMLRHYNQRQKLKIQLYLKDLDKQKKEELHQSQLRFFTNISHDFRTPLSLILATLANVKHEGLNKPYYKLLDNNAQRLLNLVNELMDFRTVANNKIRLQLELIDLTSFITKIAEEFDNYACKKDIEYNHSLDIDSMLYADKQVLEKIIINLLNNSFKYTNLGDSISLNIYLDANEFQSQYSTSFEVGERLLDKHEYYAIAVCDTGIGISQQSIKEVFERYYKVETANADMHLGTGIGLALVKELVLLHKGVITIYSEREAGTDILVSLPRDISIYKDSDFLTMASVENSCDEKDEQYKDEEIVLNTSLHLDSEDILLRDRNRILIVEDNSSLRNLIANYLSKNFEIAEAASGQEALEIIEKQSVELIISDIAMPIMDGITLCKKIKRDLKTSHIPVILLTAKTGLEFKLEGIDSGADLYFEKPMNLELLQLSIDNIFKQQDKLREHYFKNHFVSNIELSKNELDNEFLQQFLDIINENLTEPNVDVNYIAANLAMSRTKLYSKVKSLTGKSIVELILYCRMKKAAQLIIEEDLTLQEVIQLVGIKSHSYFTNVFKKEFGELPSVFASKYKK